MLAHRALTSPGFRRPTPSAALEATGLVVGRTRRDAPIDASRPAASSARGPTRARPSTPGRRSTVVVSIGQPATPSPSRRRPRSPSSTVPDVSGLAEADAAAQLEVGRPHGRRPGRAGERTRRPRAAVIRTRPEAGEVVDPGTAVDLIISIGLARDAEPAPGRPASPTPGARPRRQPCHACPRRPSPARSPPRRRPSPMTSSPGSRRPASCASTSGRTIRAGRSSRPNGQVAWLLRAGRKPDRRALGVEVAFTTEPLEDVLAGGWADRWDISFDHLVATDPRAAALASLAAVCLGADHVRGRAGVGRQRGRHDRTRGLRRGGLASPTRWFDGIVGLVDAAGGQAIPPAVGSLVPPGPTTTAWQPLLDGSVEGWAASATTIEAAIADGAPLVTATDACRLGADRRRGRPDRARLRDAARRGGRHDHGAPRRRDPQPAERASARHRRLIPARAGSRRSSRHRRRRPMPSTLREARPMRPRSEPGGLTRRTLLGPRPADPRRGSAARPCPRPPRRAPARSTSSSSSTPPARWPSASAARPAWPSPSASCTTSSPPSPSARASTSASASTATAATTAPPARPSAAAAPSCSCPSTASTAAALEDAVDAARATGWTPLAASLEPRRRGLPARRARASSTRSCS